MVLALVISLLPVQPVVKAAAEGTEKTITVTNNISGGTVDLTFTDSTGKQLDLQDNSTIKTGSQTVKGTEDYVNLNIKAPKDYAFFYDDNYDKDSNDGKPTPLYSFKDNIPKIETSPNTDVVFDTKSGRLQEYNVRIKVEQNIDLTLSGTVVQDNLTEGNNQCRMLAIDLSDFELINDNQKSAISIMLNNKTQNLGYVVSGLFYLDEKINIFPNINKSGKKTELKEGDKITISICGDVASDDNGIEYALINTPVVTNIDGKEPVSINVTGPEDGVKASYSTDKITIHGNMTLKISNKDITSHIRYISINNNLENATCDATYDANRINRIPHKLNTKGSNIKFAYKVVSGSSVIFNVKPSEDYTFVKDTENVPTVKTTLNGKEEEVAGTLNNDGSYKFDFTFKCGMSVDISGTAQTYQDLSFNASGLTGAGYTVSGDYLKDNDKKVANVTVPSSDTKTPKSLKAAIGSIVNLLINADDKKVFGAAPEVVAKDSSGNVISDANINGQEADGQTDKTSYKCAITVTDKINSIEIKGKAEIQKRTVTFSNSKLVNASYKVSGDGILEGEDIVSKDKVFENPEELTVAQGTDINIDVIPDEGYGFIAGSPVVKSGNTDITPGENGLYSISVAENTSITVSGTAINTYDVDFTSKLNGGGFDVIYTDGDGKDNNAVPVIKIGKKITVNSGKYKVTSVKGTRTVQFINGKKNVKSIVIPSTIKVSSKKYKVTSIAPNAFKGNKKLKKVVIGVNVKKIGKNAFKGCRNLKNITIKTKKLTAKRIGTNAFKGINKKAVIKVPAKKLKLYKKIIKAKGAGKKVKFKK